MNEKKLYHAALSRTLLDGENVKNRVKSRLKEEGISSREIGSPGRSGQSSRRIPRIAAAVAAAVLVLMLLFGTTAGILAFRSSRQTYAANPVETAAPSEEVLQNSPQADINSHLAAPAATEAPPVSFTQGQESYTIRLVPELENPEQYWTYRTFSEEKWGWLREISVKTATVFYENNQLRWDVQFSTDHLKTLMNPYTIGQSATEQCVDMWLDDLKYETYGEPVDADYAIDSISDIADNPMEENCLSIEGILELNALKESFPTEGTVTLIETYRVIDYNVDMQANIATIALIEHRITFDAGEVFAGRDYFPPARNTEADGSSTTILLLNDIPADRLTPKMKERRKTFSASEWSWLTGLKLLPEILFYNGDTLSWTERLSTDHIDSFAPSFEVSDGKQHVLVKADSIAIVGKYSSLSVVAEGESGDFSQSGQPLVSASESKFLKGGLLASSLWQDEDLSVTTRYWVLDHTLSNVPDEAVIAVIEHTFPVKKSDLMAFYGKPAEDITGIGVQNHVGTTIMKLDELHVKSGSLTAVLSITGADWAAFPANLTFRTEGRPAIVGTVSSGWSQNQDGRKSITLSFPTGSNPLWPGNTLVISGYLEGNEFSFSYECAQDVLAPADRNG